MPDRPPISLSTPRTSDSPSPSGDGASLPLSDVSRDAVFEDIEFGSTDENATFWEEFDVEESIAPSVPEREPDVFDVPLPAEPAGDSIGYAGATEPDYDPSAGFKIDFGGNEYAPIPEETTALAPLVRPGAELIRTEAGVSGPPALPRPPDGPFAPRAEARRSVRDKAQMLRRHKWIIIFCTLIGMLGAIAANMLMPKTYAAYSILLVKPSQEPGTRQGLDLGFGDAPGREKGRVMNQALILQQAPAIAQQTARELLRSPNPEQLSVARRAAQKFGEPVTVQTLATYLQEDGVKVTQAGEEVDAIRVEATAEDPEEAALIATLFTKEYQAIQRETNLGQVREAREILEDQATRREGELAEIEAQIESYMTSNNAAGLDEQTRVTVSQIGTLQSQLDLARVQIRMNEAQLGQLQSDLATVPRRLAASADVPSAAETTQLDSEIADLERLINQVYERNPAFGGNPNAHPDLRSMTDRLNSLQSERQRMVAGRTGAAVRSGGLDVSSTGANGQAYLADLQRQISQTRAALEGARAQASTLAGRLAQATGKLSGVPRQQMTLAQLERRRQTSQQTVGQLTQERDNLRLAESTELGSTQTIRDVQVPRKPSSPKMLLNLVLGTLLGLMIGLAGAAIRYRTDARAHTPDDLVDQGFAVVGTVPDLSAALRESRTEVDGMNVHPALVTLTHPFSPAAEAFRHIHANLYSGAESVPQVVLVSGPELGTGKSLVATNLAVAAAQAGRRVLLVDADLRKPTVNSLLGLNDRPALGEGPEGTNLVYWSTAVPSLFAMTPREMAERPDQMWAPHQIGALLANLRAAFDLILIDAPAALVAADAALLAPHADAGLLVAESRRSDLDAMAQVATELSGVGLTRVGAVLNRFNPRRAVGYKKTTGIRHSIARANA